MARDNHPDRLIDDSEGLTRSDLEWLRIAKANLTPDMIAKIKKRDEERIALGILITIGGVLVGWLGIDKIAKFIIKAFEILGGGK